MTSQDWPLLLIPIAGSIWIIALIWLFLVPEREVCRLSIDDTIAHCAVIALVSQVGKLLNPPGEEKRRALLVEEARWEGVDAWLEAWRGKPWPQKRTILKR